MDGRYIYYQKTYAELPSLKTQRIIVDNQKQ